MICHSTDVNAPEYDITDAPKPGHERVGAGRVVLVKLELDELRPQTTLKEYRKLEGKPFTLAGNIKAIPRPTQLHFKFELSAMQTKTMTQGLFRILKTALELLNLLGAREE